MNFSTISNLLSFNPVEVIVSALVVLNGATFFLFGFDKWMASGRRWRVPESVLWMLAALGGSIGALAGMSFFRHKTKKTSFQFILALIICLQALATFLILYVL